MGHISDKLVDRQAEFPALLDSGGVYADWTGAALSPKSLVERHCRLLTTRVLGNPHSHHLPSMESMEILSEARDAVLRHVGADASEYDVIFTANASAAILLLQHFMFEGGDYLMTADNHNSVNGLREVAKRAGATVRYSPLRGDLSLDPDRLGEALTRAPGRGRRLFAMPSKSNYSGRLHPRIWLGLARENGWRTLYDMSAELANLEEPQVSLYKPDFVPMSFYKMFGYPTGVGALLVRREAQSDLHKRWFAGGSILLVSVMMDFFAPEVSPHGRFEDGTTAFSAIAAVPMGLEFLRGLAGRGEHARGLGTRLRSEIERFGTGPDRIDLYSPGGTDVVTFGLYREGRYVDAWHVEIAARRRKIALRTGCFCNPGCNERVFAYPLDGVRDFWDKSRSDESLTIEALRPYTGNAPIGAVRASFGYANVGSDVDKIADFLREMLEVPVGALVGDDA